MSDCYLPDNEPHDILLSLEELSAKKLPHAPTFKKAADEIKRLRTELKESRRLFVRDTDEYIKWTDEAKVEIEKLRTTLSQTELYVVIEEDRGLGPMVLAVFKSEVGAIDFAKKRSHVEVHNANLLD